MTGRRKSLFVAACVWALAGCNETALGEDVDPPAALPPAPQPIPTEEPKALGEFRFATFLSASDGLTLSASQTASDGEVLLVGQFEGELQIGDQVLESAGGTDVFVTMLDPMGGHRWSRAFGGTGNDAARGVEWRTDGTVVVAGVYQTSFELGGASLRSSAFEGAFVTMLDPMGGHRWSRSYIGKEAGASVEALTSRGDIIVVSLSSVGGVVESNDGSPSLVEFIDPMDGKTERQLLSSINRWTQLGLDAHYNLFVGGFRFDETHPQPTLYGLFPPMEDNISQYIAGSGAVRALTVSADGESVFAVWARPFELSVDRLTADPNVDLSTTVGTLELKGVDVFDWARVREARIDTWNNLLLVAEYGEGSKVDGKELEHRGGVDVALLKMKLPSATNESLNHQWARTMASAQDDRASSVMVDAWGQSFVTANVLGKVVVAGKELAADGPSGMIMSFTP